MSRKPPSQLDLALANSKLADLTKQFEDAQGRSEADRRLAEAAKADAKRAKKSYKHARKVAKESRRQAKALKRELKQLSVEIAAIRGLPSKSDSPGTQNPAKKAGKTSSTVRKLVRSQKVDRKKPTPTPLATTPSEPAAEASGPINTAGASEAVAGTP